MAGEFDLTEILTHKVLLDQAHDAYNTYYNHADECIKFVLCLRWHEKRAVPRGIVP